MSERDDALVRALPLGDQWQVYGADAMRGISIEGLKLDADDFGPRQMSGNLKRDPGVAWGDLQAATPLEVEIGGSLLWGGRQKESPTSEVNRQIAISGEGWQYHMDDDDYQNLYVQTSLSAWGDIRSSPQCDLSVQRAVWQLSSDPGGLTITAPNTQLIETVSRGGYLIDLGPNQLAKRIVYAWKHSNNAPSISLGILAGSSIASASNSVPGTITTLAVTPVGSGAITCSARWLWIGLFNNTAGTVTPGADCWAQLTGIQVFGDTAYESGGASVLFASTVIKDALTHAPLLSADQSQIAATAFAIPDFAPTSYQTPRELCNAVNAYHAYQFRINADRRPEYRARPIAPLLTALAGTFEDASAGSIEQVYNKCIGQATGPDGVAIVSTQFGSGTIPDRRGYYRTNVLNTNMSLTQTALDQMTATFISGHGRMPFKGTYTVSGWDAVAFTVGGAKVPAWELLRYVGEMIHFPNQTDPDTGAKGRDGRISAVSYDHDTRTAAVSIDSQRSNFEALLARLQVVTGRVA